MDIARLKDGGDALVYKKFVRRFIKVHQLLADEANTQPADRRLEVARSLLEDALEECDVKAFIPSLGADSRTVKGLDDPLIVPSTDLAQHYRIAEVTMPGYQLQLPGGEAAIITPARVKVYGPEEQSNG
jgi:hypothetical protein